MFKSAKPVNQYDEQGNLIKEFGSLGKAAKALKLDYPKFSKAVNGNKPYAGFIWKFKETAGFVPQQDIPQPVAESPKEQVLQVTASQLNDLIGRAIEKHVGRDNTKEVLRELAISINPDAVNRHIYTEETVPVEDYLPEPVMFYTYSHKYAINAERRYGQEVTTPYNRLIRFTNFSVQVLGAGKYGREKEVRQLAMAMVTSKKEAEWLRKSPKYNVVFFENSRDAAKVDVFTAEKLVEAMNEIAHLDYMGIRTRCKNLGVADTSDIENMRRALAIAIAERNREAERRLRVKDVVPMDLDLNRREDRDLVRVQVS